MISPVSKREKITFQIIEMKNRVFMEQGGMCWYCEAPMRFLEFELAHRAPQRDWIIRKWGEGVVHHRKNLVGTHSGHCNSRAQLDPNSVECDEHLASIRKEIESGEDHRG